MESKSIRLIKFSNVDSTGKSRQIYVSELPIDLQSAFGNGASIFRKGSYIDKNFYIKVYRENDNTINSKITSFQFMGIKKSDTFSNRINGSISSFYKKNSKKSVLSGFTFNDKSASLKMNIDHKNGVKNSEDIGKGIQSLDDFQPITQSENIIKREICKKCKNNNKRFEAPQGFIDWKGIPYKYYQGGETLYDNPNEIPVDACKGCYLNDPVLFTVMYMVYAYNEGFATGRTGLGNPMSSSEYVNSLILHARGLSDTGGDE